MSHTGSIISFGAAKGFGFISCEQVPGDVFFGRNSLPAELQKSGELFPLKGLNVQFDLKPQEPGETRPQALNMKFIVTEGEMCVGTIKSYNPVKGFGFISSSCLEGSDFFFAKRDVPQVMQDVNLQGTVVGFKVASTPDGKIQAKQLMMQAPLSLVQQMTGTAAPMQQATQGPQAGRVPMVVPMQRQAVAGAQTAPLGTEQRLQGTVKTFNDAKDFGFVTSPSVSADVYFKGQGTIYQPGYVVEFTLHITPDGRPQARDVALLSMDGPPPDSQPTRASQVVGAQQPARAAPGTDVGTFPATITTYSARNGYGFFTVEGMGDVYFKKSVLPAHMQEAEIRGMQGTIDIRLTQDGKPQCARADFSASGAPAGGVKRSAPVPTTAVGLLAQPAKMQRVDTGAPASLTDGGGPFTGVIQTFNPVKGFGFIQSVAAATDIFFSGKKLPVGLAGVDLQGRSVVFHLAWTQDGKPQANNIQVQ